MGNITNDQLKQFVYTINIEQNYIKGHDIGREMLLRGDDKQLAKLLASIAGLLQQFSNRKIAGYTKFRRMVAARLTEIPNHPFDERHLMSELDRLDDILNEKRYEDKQKHPFQLKLIRN